MGDSVIYGAEIKGNDLIFVGVALDSHGNYGSDPSSCHKLSLADSKDQASVKDFARAVAAVVRAHSVNHIALRGRNTSGQYGGGAVSFKIEGIIQCLEGCSVEIIMPTASAASQRRHGFIIPTGLLKYRENAFLTGCTALAKMSK